MPTVWRSHQWRSEVEAWVQDVLSEQGIGVTGAVDQPRVRSWSTQLVVPTTEGRMWFKENHPAQRAEAAVIEVIAGLAPEQVVVPVAVQRRRGWLLSRDQGPTLAAEERTDEALWARLTVEFAGLQRRLAGHRAELAAAGLAALPPVDVAGSVERQVAVMRAMPQDSAVHIDAALAGRALAALPALRATAARLEATAALTSLDHNDLHLNNVFARPPGGSALRFFDFGDALWAHPFTSLSVPVGSMCADWEVEPSDPRVLRVVDAYLEVWSDIAGRAPLREAAALAMAFGPVNRFESWRRLVADSSASEAPEGAQAVRRWLGQVADTPYP